jgi:hypothetical protein
MTAKTAVVFSCAHSDPSTGNERFDWLGELIYEVNPTYIIDLGDGADMRSLNTFDTRYPEAIVSQNYEQDINCYNEAMDRLRKKPSDRKYKRPYWIGFEGNHENRIKKAIAHEPRLQFPSAIFKRTTGSTNTTNTLIAPPLSLTMMAFLTLTSLVVVILVQLCLVYITLIAYSPIVITVLLVGIAINVILSLKMAHTLMGLSVWLRVATKAQKKRGLDRQIETGGKVV